jgi:hypothetical protein
MGVCAPITFKLGNLVMLYNGKLAKKKLYPAYWGPFKIVSLGGFHGKSYLLE